MQANPRLIAIKTLSNVLDKGQNLSDADRTASLADERDRSLARHLAYGVCRWLNTLEWLASQLLLKPLKKRVRGVRVTDDGESAATEQAPYVILFLFRPVDS